MKTLRAVNTIVMTLEPGKAGDKSKGLAPVRPKTIEIKPNARFKAQDLDQEKDLLAQGAAVVAGPVEEDEVTETAVVKPAKPAQKAKAGTKANVSTGKVEDVMDRDADDDVDVDGDNKDADGDDDLV